MVEANGNIKTIVGTEKLKAIYRPNFFFLFLVICLSSKNGFAQFTIDARYRNRFELRDGYKKFAAPGTEPAAFISQRTRMSFRFENEQLKLKITPQDVRVWGDEQLSSSTGVYGDNASLDLFAACTSNKKKEQTISLSGAFALYPLVIKWSEEYQKENPDVRFNISAGGAGKGMADALSGMVDLGMFSREIAPDEIDKGVWWLAVTKDAVIPTCRQPGAGSTQQTGKLHAMNLKVYISTGRIL